MKSLAFRLQAGLLTLAGPLRAALITLSGTHKNPSTLTTISIMSTGIFTSAGKRMEAASFWGGRKGVSARSTRELASVSGSIVLTANSKKLSKPAGGNIHRLVRDSDRRLRELLRKTVLLAGRSHTC